MVLAHALDFPKVEPDDWNVFWNIWSQHAKPLIKYVNEGTTPWGSASKLGSRDHWIGLEVYHNNLRTNWIAPFVDISKSLPNMYKALLPAEIPNIRKVRIIQSMMPHPPHSDKGIDFWEIRAMLQCDNPSEHWYYTPYGNKTKKLPLKLPNETNWFTYNDGNCHHGTEYFPLRPKYLVQIYYTGELATEIRTRGINKYPDCVIEI